MAEDLDKLLKSEDRNRRANDNSSKKLWESKRRLSGICRSLTVNTKYYDPKITVAKIDAYIAETDKVDRQCHLVKQMAEEEYLREKMIYGKESHLLFFAARQKDRWTSASK